MWTLGFVSEELEHLVTVLSNSEGLRHKLGIAYEDIRLVPSSALLYEIDKLELELGQDPPEKSSEGVYQMATDSSATKPTSISEEMENESLSLKGALWTNHSLSGTMYSTRGTSVLNEPAFDI